MAELNSIRHLLALLGAHHILHVSSIRVKFMLTFDNEISFESCQCHLLTFSPNSKVCSPLLPSHGAP